MLKCSKTNLKDGKEDGCLKSLFDGIMTKCFGSYQEA